MSIGCICGCGGMKRRNITPGYAEICIGLDVSAEAVELGQAIERYRARVGRRHMTDREVLAVAKAIGWRKDCPETVPIH